MKSVPIAIGLGGSFALFSPTQAGGPFGDSGPDVETTSGSFVGRAWVFDVPGFGPANIWRVYVDIGVGNQVTAVFGDMGSPLLITSSTGFYQDPFGGLNEPTEAFPEFAANDSFVTIGNPSVGLGETATGLSPFFPSGDPDGDPWDNGALETMNGSWLRTPDDPLTHADSDGVVMIGQFTVADGARIDGLVNFTNVIDGQSGIAEGLTFNFAVPSPGVLAILGLAAIAGTRRHRDSPAQGRSP